MANFITTSITWNGKETLDFFFKPLFVGQSPYSTQGVRIIPNVQSVQKLNFIGAANKITKAYAKGFSGTNSGSYTQRDLTVYQLKAEKAQDANEFYQTVLETIQGKGYEWNDIKSAGQINEIVMSTFIAALQSDIFRIFWLADTAKETVSSGVWSGTADTDYNMFDGMLIKLIDNAATSPSASQFKKVAMSHGAIPQVDTHTLTGASGTATIAIDTTTYLATFTTTLTGTAAAFVTSHAAALLLRDIVVTSLNDTIILTSARAGRPFVSANGTNVTGDLDSTVANTTANTAPAALASDEAIGYCKSLFQDSDAVLRNLPNNEKVFLMDSASYYNLQSTLEADAVPNSYEKLENGVEVLKYRGVVVLKMDWDVYSADFPVGYPNIIIYTYMQNLVLGIDTASEGNMIQEWLNEDEQENRFRAQWKMGVNYVHEKYTSIAF